MKVVPLLFFLLAASIQGGFAALDNDNPLTNPDLPPKVRAHLESRILEWLCPRIKMTASNYIRSRLYPLSDRLTASLSSIPALTRPSPAIFPYLGRPFPWYLILPYTFKTKPLQSWLEQLTPAQKQKLDAALMVSVAAFLKTLPNAFMVVCLIDNDPVFFIDDGVFFTWVGVYTLNADVNDTVSIYLSPSNSNQAVLGIDNSYPTDTWQINNPFSFTCRVKHLNALLTNEFYWGISSVTYSHGGKQIVLTQGNPIYSSD